MKWGGFTSAVYTAAQFEKISEKQMVLIMGYLTVLMLFFMANADTYLKSTDKDMKELLKAAGIAGLVTAAASSADSFVRTKISDFRFFGEVSIASGYLCLWLLFGMVFQLFAAWAAIASYLLAVVVGSILSQRTWGLEEGEIVGVDLEVTTFIDALVAADTPQAREAITRSALTALLNSPGDPATVALVAAARQLNGIAAAPAENDGGCC